ncbi:MULTISPECIES: hypothetical protein [unclassified Bradyrhizobium]|uniref:hypothetical protein n=1 Tax=unclassified Bradyrhizobium TaxID=2631580 RepID=UPI0023061CD3|nr:MULTISPECIES: hypothetical protein [unclassified Bradyrhizobium]MDA9450781.1 hypothetical protein [Bradyrhizobium sp. CCBAU 21360]MDA9458534.1 hypothetical protein [Bradyrhizobium sp. CCBAU 21359]MDA9517803.1 hypothetical protein [Bradyrhizobium sp. CCBAU 11430]
MTSDNSAAVISLHQDPPKSKAMTGAERAKAYRDRKRTKAPAGAVAPRMPARAAANVQSKVSPPDALPAPAEALTPPTVTTDRATPVTPAAATPLISPPVTPSRLNLASAILMVAAVALAGVGVAVNGWFARSLGSSDAAGWLFLALGMAADLIALGMPSCAANLWQIGRRGSALLGWALWLLTFVFVVTAGLGFASTNISDVTLARASRVTPVVTGAQAALSDAMAARDRECKGGVGKFCREREATVLERRQALETAVAAIGRAADPQTDAAVKLVAWATFGSLRPASEDFAMLRLVLLALLPQVGGLLMLVARRSVR